LLENKNCDHFGEAVYVGKKGKCMNCDVELTESQMYIAIQKLGACLKDELYGDPHDRK